MDSLQQLNQEGKHQNMVGEMIPEGVNYNVYFFLRADRGSCVMDCKEKV